MRAEVSTTAVEFRVSQGEALLLALSVIFFLPAMMPGRMIYGSDHFTEAYYSELFATERLAEGELTVSARTPDVGEARETVPVPFQGEPFEIGFNPEFLRDGLESAESDELVLKLISPLRPGLIQSGDEDAGFRYLVMPIRLNV